MKCHDRCSEWTNERNSNKRKGGGGGVEDEEEVLEWGQAVLLLLFWNTASLFSLWLDEVLSQLSWEKRIFFFICVCLFVPSRIDSRLLVFRIRLPVTLSVKGEKKKKTKRGRRRNPTWRNHTSLKKKQLISVASTKEKAKILFFFIFFPSNKNRRVGQ